MIKRFICTRSVLRIALGTGKRSVLPKREAQNPVQAASRGGGAQEVRELLVGWLSVALMGSHFGGLLEQVSADWKKLNR